MREYLEKRLYSASDLVNFLGCIHATALDLRQLVEPAALPPDDDYTVLLQQKGIAHERSFLETLRAEGRSIVEIPDNVALEERVARTHEALRNGPDVIYQGALFEPPWHGFSDFLLRVNGVRSALGDYAYDIADTKLARTAKPKHVLQLCVYGDLLTRAQGVEPPHLHVALGNGTHASIRTADVRHYAAIARDRFEAFVSGPALATKADPCGHCSFCRWKSRCEDFWNEVDDLSLVANISRGQREKLAASGVGSMHALAQLPAGSVIANLQAATLERLRGQAELQVARRDQGTAPVTILPAASGRGFQRLPEPDPSDLFFDMEGDPLFEGGLEYLFGFTIIENGQPKFQAFWGHDRAGEKQAFEQAVDFAQARLLAAPKAHIYHYGTYEPNALKRLAMYHGTRETAIDDLLRQGKLVDLYKVVTEALQIGEPRYSLKNLETYYLDQKRGGEVVTAGESVVMYERWRSLGDDAILAQIQDYNEADCRSTWQCRDWLLRNRPQDTPWFVSPNLAREDAERVAKRAEADAQITAMVAALLNCPEPERPWRELLAHLLEFHRREAKPAWWAQFARAEMSEEQLIDDVESIGGLRSDGKLPRKDKKSEIFGFSFPPQDFKMRIGDKPTRVGTLEPAGEIVALDEKAGTIELKLGPSRTRLGAATSLIPESPMYDKVLREALYRYAQAVVDGQQDKYAAITDILRQVPPRLRNHLAGTAIIPDERALLEGTKDALSRLQNSYLLIQGPPGAGKTYTASHAILALIAAGKTIGVASNSHKAINTLLAEVEEFASQTGQRYRGIKKSSDENQFLEGARNVANTLENADAEGAGYQLVAGTAWLFARPAFDQRFDYLFVDEAGQVSLANIVAMGVSAHNVVLIGDQMQLSQPIQGSHPGGSGRSALDHLLGDTATVPPDRGIFLPITRRMHPAVCIFISEAVYDGRLHADDGAGRQELLLDASRDPVALASAGIRFVPVVHEGCTQQSRPEADRLAQTYQSMLGQRWRDRDGAEKLIGTDDILVVSPYNMQVNLLQAVLPQGARVGTIDKFQGQEAAAVLLSMVTSSGEDLPRQIEFLYSRNRLNVAISRAHCLAVVFANLRLLEISCSTVEQMKLVNTLCWVKTYSDDSQRASR